MKKFSKRYYLILLALLVAAVLVPALSFVMRTSAATVTSGNGTWIEGKLTYTYTVATSSDNTQGANGSVTAALQSNGYYRLSLSATSAAEYTTSGCNSTTVAAAATTTTVTVTNASQYPLKITVLTPSGYASIDGVAQGDTIASGAKFTITVTSPANGTSNTKREGFYEIAVEEQTNVTVTLAPSPYVGYTVNGVSVAQNGSEQTFSTDVGTTIALPTITAPAGYEFKGWRIGSTMTTASSFTADGAYTVFPVIVTEGTDITSANFKVGSSTYTFWEDAVLAAVNGTNKTIIVNRDATLPGSVLDNLLSASGGTYVKPVSGGGVEYILPSGVTLLVPFNSSNTVITNSNIGSNYEQYQKATAKVEYRRLTLASGAQLTVTSGASVSVASKVYCMSSGQSGPYGLIYLNDDSSIVFQSSTNLYCFGYIIGTGSVDLLSGAKAYGSLFVDDYPGSAKNVNTQTDTNKVFPFSEFSVRNFQAPTTFHSSATLDVYFNVYGTSVGYHDTWVSFIGNTSALLSTSGTVTISYEGAYTADVRTLFDAKETDPDARQILSFNGTSSINSMKISLSAFGITISVNTNNLSGFLLPHNYDIRVESGSTTINENLICSKGSKIVIANGATVTLASGKNAYVLDGTDDPQPIGAYPDAMVDVNGTVQVNGKIWTSTNKANIISSKGTGKIVLSSANSNGATVAVRNGTSTKKDVSVNPASLHNGATYADTDREYVETTGVSGTFFYSAETQQWYRYKVDYVLNGTVVYTDYTATTDSAYTADGITISSASATNGTASVDGGTAAVTGLSGDSTVTLTGTAGQFVPVFVLNGQQYGHYQRYTGNTLNETVTINDETFYVVSRGSAAALGSAVSAPSDASVGVTAGNQNGIEWRLGNDKASLRFNGTVPAGESEGGDAYVYGFYSGMVASVTVNGTTTCYPTLADAVNALPKRGSALLTLLADCGSMGPEDATATHRIDAAATITIDLNGHEAWGALLNSGTLTLDLNGGTWKYHTGATAAYALYKRAAAIVNSGTLTVQDSVGGGTITADAISNDGIPNNSAVINNKGTMTVTGVTLENTQDVNSYVSVVLNDRGTITALQNVTMRSPRGYAVFNYGGEITSIDSCDINVAYGIYNRNIRGSNAISAGYNIANYGVIGTISNCHVEAGQYAINNSAVINTLSNSTFIAHPDSAQVNTYGTSAANVHGNVPCYTVYNSPNWFYDSNVWKQVDSSSNGYKRTNYYKEEEEFRPTIGTIENCEIYAENTSTSEAHGYALVNYGVINKIGGTTNIKVYKHPDNAKISVAYYGLHNLGGGIIKSIEGNVNVSATGIGTVYNDSVFTKQINYTYGNKVGGNITHQYSTYGEPSTIQSITCGGTWSCGSYYCLMNSGYIQTINAPNLTLQGNTSSYNVLYNTTGGANSTYDYTCEYTDVATAATAYHSHAVYTKNLEKGSTIGTLNGVTVIGKYSVLNNQGHIGTLSNVSVSNNAASNNPTFLNGDSRYATVIEDRKDVAHYAEDYPKVTISAGYATRYDRDYTYSVPTIDVIDNLTVTSNGQYALRNAGVIGTMRNSAITSSAAYALHNSATGPYTERTTVQYYSGTSVFATTKYTSEYASHYLRDPSTITMIDNCTIQTNAAANAVLNVGHIGTIQNSELRAGATTAAATALANINSREREYTRDTLDDVFYVTANAGTACTAYWGSGGETNVVVYDYDAPEIDLIGEGNTFEATTNVIANTGVITAIDSGEGTLTTITGSTARGRTIYNYNATLDARTTTTPYTAAETLPASGTAGTAVDDDTYLPGAQIGTIKNVYIDANGYGILNGDANASYLPVIGEIGEGTEIYAHCTTAAYHAIANQSYAEITSITGGVFTVTKATTNAYLNGYNVEGAEEHATLISGGYFKGMDATRANAIYKPDDTSRQTYPAGYTLSKDTQSVTLHDGTTAPCYFIAKLVTVTFDMQGHDTENTPANQTVESGQKATAPTAPAADATVNENNSFYRFDGWYTTDQCTTAFDFDTVVTANTTVYAKWTELTPTAKIGTTNYLTLAAAVAAAQNGDTVTMLANETLSTMVAIEGKSITLDLNGHTVSKNTASTIQIKNTGSLTVRDSSQNGKVLATAATAGSSDAIVVLAGGTFTLESGTIQSNTYGISTLGTVTVTGGTVIGETGVLYSIESGTIAVSGGWFSHAVSSDDCAAGYHPITDATHDPQYTVSNLYTITWVDGDGTTLKTEQVAYGQTPAYTGETPTKTATAQYTYTFAGWSTDGETAIDPLPAVTGDETYTAIFTAVPNHVHSLEYHQAVAATCTEAGNSAYWSCACGKYFSDAEGNTEIAANSWVISATGHTVVTDAAVAATCTETGLTEGSHCSVCNAVLTAQEVVPATGHTAVTDAAVAPSCTETGLTEGSHCSVCNAVLTAQEVVPATGHTAVTDAAVAATCTETGLTEGSHCSVCNAVLTAQEVVPATGHTAVTDAAVAPSCTETGLTEGSHCSVCNAVLTAQEVIPALGHDYVDHEAKAATCTAPGWNAYQTCSRCDYTSYAEIPATGHTTVTDAAVEATCTETGLTEGSHCSVCSEILVAQETIPALGHDIVVDAAVAATCTETGLTEGSHCSRCDYAVAQEEIPALGHDWDEGVTVALGTLYTCKRCNKTKLDQSSQGGMHLTHTPVLHEAVPATCTEQGNSAYYTCSGCGLFFSDEACENQIEEGSWEIEALGHRYETHDFVDATCTEPGNLEYFECTRCGKFFDDTDEEINPADMVIDAKGHDLVHHEGKAPTCSESGWAEYDTCTRCDYTTYEELAAVDHNYVDGYCTYCGAGDGTNTEFKFASAKLVISKDIVVTYAGAVPAGWTDPYVIFTFNGRDYRVNASGTDDKGRYLFPFEGVTPEKMGDNICATLYATTAAGNPAHVCKESYSVREYCVNTMIRYQNIAGSDKLLTLLTDTLAYGEAAQRYTKYHTDALVTEGVNMERVSTFTEVTETKLAITGEVDENVGWNSASLQCGSKMAMLFTFHTNEPETTTVEVTINGRLAVYDIPASRVNANGTYTTVFPGIAATEFDDTVTAIIKVNGEQVGQTLTYSVNSYVYSMQNNTSVENLAALVRAIYNYGKSAKAYAG